MVTLAQLNELTTQQFTAALGAVFENSPWVAERVAVARPFASRLDLLDGMRAVVAAASSEEKMRLIQEHPRLGTSVPTAPALTDASRQEQRRAGLSDCTPDEAARLRQLNAEYEERFGFPFIMAVRGYDPVSIIRHIERRLRRDARTERVCALENVGRIAGFRLGGWVGSAAPAEIVAMHERWQRHAPTTVRGTDEDDMPLLREWMLAAGLEVDASTARWLRGSWHCGAPRSSTAFAGVLFVPEQQRLVEQGPLSVMIAIAVVGHLRLAGRRLPYDLTVLAQPADAAHMRDGMPPDQPRNFAAVGPARDPDESASLNADLAAWRARAFEQSLLALQPPFTLQ